MRREVFIEHRLAGIFRDSRPTRPGFNSVPTPCIEAEIINKYHQVPGLNFREPIAVGNLERLVHRVKAHANAGLASRVDHDTADVGGKPDGRGTQSSHQ